MGSGSREGERKDRECVSEQAKAFFSGHGNGVTQLNNAEFTSCGTPAHFKCRAAGGYHFSTDIETSSTAEVLLDGTAPDVEKSIF